MSDDACGAPKAAPPKGRLAFGTIYLKTAEVVGLLTAVVILLREAVTLLTDVPRVGLAAALWPFAVRLVVKVTVVSVINCFALALPIAGFVYYIHHLAEER